MMLIPVPIRSLQWRHNGCYSVSNHQPHHCLPNGLFRRRSKKTSKLRVTGLCAGNSPGTGEFPAQMASNAENVSIWWRHHDTLTYNVANFFVFIAIKVVHHFWAVSVLISVVDFSLAVPKIQVCIKDCWCGILQFLVKLYHYLRVFHGTISLTLQMLSWRIICGFKKMFYN